jgi:hypothetical protein
VFLQDKGTLSWDSVGPSAGDGTVYDVVRGYLSELPVGRGASETCLARGLAEAATVDTEVPPPGEGYWYLVRGRNGCGIGGYGTASAGQVRSTTVCIAD